MNEFFSRLTSGQLLSSPKRSLRELDAGTNKRQHPGAPGELESGFRGGSNCEYELDNERRCLAARFVSTQHSSTRSLDRTLLELCSHQSNNVIYAEFYSAPY